MPGSKNSTGQHLEMPGGQVLKASWEWWLGESANEEGIKLSQEVISDRSPEL